MILYAERLEKYKEMMAGVQACISVRCSLKRVYVAGAPVPLRGEQAKRRTARGNSPFFITYFNSSTL